MKKLQKPKPEVVSSTPKFIQGMRPQLVFIDEWVDTVSWDEDKSKTEK